MTSVSLGIDLASQPAKTAACTIVWSETEPRATASCPVLGVTDADVLALAAGTDIVGIDAPFGWPDPFVAFFRAGRAPEDAAIPWTPARRDSLRFRATDVRVRERLGRWPLSVSTDRIALAALRCAGLLQALGVDDRSGARRVVEVYPAAALHAWGLTHRGYKPREGVSVPANPALAALLEDLLSRCPWLGLPDDAYRLCARNDDAFDALIAAIVARAAAQGRTVRPMGDDAERATREGWIAVPVPGSLERLVPDASERLAPCR